MSDYLTSLESLCRTAQDGPSDEELLIRYRETGDRNLYENLVRRYEREIYTFLRRYLGNAQLAEDTFQATFLSVHLRADQFEEGRRFRPWLYAIATNKAIDCQRRTKRHRHTSLDAVTSNQVSEGRDNLAARLVDLQPDPSSIAACTETGERVRAALQELNEPTQQLIQLAFYQGMKYSDIGEILGIPVGTVKSRVHTAMRRLNEIWHRMFPEDDQIDERNLGAAKGDNASQ